MGTISATLVGVGLLTLACGLTEEDHAVTSTGGGPSAAGGGGSGGEIPEVTPMGGGLSAAGAGGSGGETPVATPIGGGPSAAGGASSAAGGVTVSEPLCSTPTTVDPPSPADDCVVAPRIIDPESTSGAAACPITRAFDLSCEGGIDDPRLSSLGDRTLLLVDGSGWAGARLLTVTDTETEVSQIDALHESPYRLSSTTAGTWYVARAWSGIIAVYGNGETWSESTVVSDPSSGWARVSDAAMVDETQGYVAYRQEVMGIPHLVTWDGACWTDEVLTDAATRQLYLAVDADGLPWTAWVQQDTEGGVQIVLRDPTEATRPVHVATEGWRVTASTRSVIMLPGGLDGQDPYPALAVFDGDGINVVRRDSGSQAGWSAVVLPDSSPGSIETDCPGWPSDDSDPCEGLTSCTTQVEGNGGYFGLARTASQGAFAVWVSYSSLADSMLDVTVDGDDLLYLVCTISETTGSGTAELVLARLGDDEPVLSRYRFDLDGGLLSLWQPLAVAARGDTLVVTAVVSGGDSPALTYFEIDATQLP
jgi:hypothetical protein